MGISNFFQFIVGFIAGVLLLAGSTATVGFYLFNKMAANPPKPNFPELANTQEESTTSTQVTSENTSTQVEQVEQVRETIPPSSLTDSLELPSGSYRATVTWPQGLIFRAEPTRESERLGGISYQEEVIVLGSNDDKTWENILLPRTGQQGWVSAGNTQPIQ